MRGLIHGFLFCLFLMILNPAYAACTGPAGVAGMMDYAGAPDHVFKYCDGTNWKPMSLPACTAGQGLVMGATTWQCCPAFGAWTSVPFANSNSVYTIGHGNGLYIAAGTGGLLRTSPDSLNWTDRTSPNIFWYDIAYGNGIFVLSPYSGSSFLTSTDGVTWTTRPAPVPGRRMTHANNRFVSVTPMRHSTDGIAWANATSAPSGDWSAVTHGNGLFVAVMSDRVASSTDGLVWTEGTAPSGNWGDVAYGNGMFVAVAFGSGGTHGVMTSPDGLNLTAALMPGIQSSWNRIVFSNGTFAATRNGYIALSPNGTSWTASAEPLIGSIPRIGAANDVFLATGTGTTALSRSQLSPCP
jgi:hypothetical protein